MRLGAVDPQQRSPDRLQDRFWVSGTYRLLYNRSQWREGPRRLKGCFRTPRNSKSRRLLPSRRRLTCPIVVVRACAARIYAAQMYLQSKNEVVSFGYSLKRNLMLTLRQTQGRWYDGVAYCRSSYSQYTWLYRPTYEWLLWARLQFRTSYGYAKIWIKL